MGADLLLIAARAPHFEDGSVPGDETTLQRLASQRVTEWAARVQFDSIAWDEIRSVLEFGDDEEQDKPGRIYLQHAMMACVEYLFGKDGESAPWRRDITSIWENGVPRYIVTGGMSWGDSPTQSWDYLAPIASAHLFDDPFTAADVAAIR